jgi:hypothetical protein
MEKETITRQLAAITQALEDVTKELKVYSSVVQDGTVGKDLEDLGRISESYEDLIASVRSLNRAARGPVDLLLSQVEHVSPQIISSSPQIHFCVVTKSNVAFNY